MSARTKVGDIYIRESKDELARGYSPDEMLRKCRLVAATLGCEIGREVLEVGKRDEYECPELIEEIERAKRGEIDYLISYDMLRLTGDIAKHLWLKDQIEKTSCIIRYSEAEYADNAEGELAEGVQGIVGRYERLKTRQRTQNGISGKLARNEPICGGRTPYGLQKVYNTDRKPVGWERGPKLAVLERIVDELATDTLAEVCARLNAEGEPTPEGTEDEPGIWRSGTILSLLDNKVYTGLYEFGVLKFTPKRNAAGKRRFDRALHPEDHIRRIAFDPFIPPASLARARAAMAARKLAPKGRMAPDDDPFTLRGRLRCGHCQGAMSATKNNGVRYYICLRAYPHNPKSLPVGRGAGAAERCPMKLVPAGPIETWTWQRMAESLGDRDLVVQTLEEACRGDEAAQRHAEQRASAEAAIERLVGRIARAGEELLDLPRDSESAQSLREMRARSEGELAEFRVSLAQLEEQAPVLLERADADLLLREIDAIVEGLEVTGQTPAEQREQYRLFRVALWVGMAEAGSGVRFGERYAYAVGLEGLLSHPGKLPWGISLRWNNLISGCAFTFERQGVQLAS